MDHQGRSPHRTCSHRRIAPNSLDWYLLMKLVALLVSLVAVALPGLTQQQKKLTDFTQPASHFPYLISPYKARSVPEPQFTNTPRLETLMKDGSIMLSMGDAIALALENNLDLAIARYNLSIADTDILRARAGSSIRGVATGVVQGTPGGGVNGFGSGASGSGAGGTTTAAGGAGTGAAGQVLTTTGVGAPV